ncbi:cystathionine beta-lyase [Sesbania bispinosa]|nr:cystathionine beta-lyase [Sesbania bispinosa]
MLNGNICWKRYHLLPILEACSVIGLWTLPVSPSSQKSKTYLPTEGSHVRSEIGCEGRSNLKGSLG